MIISNNVLELLVIRVAALMIWDKYRILKIDLSFLQSWVIFLLAKKSQLKSPVTITIASGIAYYRESRGCKHLRFDIDILLFRLQIAVLHFNENCNRKQAETKDGVKRHTL